MNNVPDRKGTALGRTARILALLRAVAGSAGNDHHQYEGAELTARPWNDRRQSHRREPSPRVAQR